MERVDGWSLGIVFERKLVAEEGTRGVATAGFRVSYPWVAQQGEEEAGVLRHVADHLACSPYRLMERFLMDGLYPSSLKCFCGPFYSHANSAPLCPCPRFALGVQGGSAACVQTVHSCWFLTS